MANITWNITQLECKPQDGDYGTVVVNVHWICSGFNFDLNGAKYESYVYGSVSLPPPQEVNFIPYDLLTLDEVLNWVWANGVDKAETELRIVNEINDQINPPIVKPTLPWEAVVVSDPQPETGETNG